MAQKKMTAPVRTPRTKARPAAKPKQPAHPRSAAATRSATSAEVGVRVRMYRVGFGDFFLVSFGPEGARAHVLIDCGVHSGTTGKGDIGTIQSAVADMVKETGGELALVVMTHRHADHIAGFARCRDQFEGFRVGAVWLPAWEDEYDPSARKFQAELTDLATRVHAELAARTDPEAELLRDMMYNATGLGGVGSAELGAAGAAAGGSNAKALDLLKNGLKVTPEYYAAGDAAKLPAALAKLGVAVRVLGPPPVADEELMKLMDLKKGVGQYLDATREGAAGKPFRPFGAEWDVDARAYPEEAFRGWNVPAPATQKRTPPRKASPPAAHQALEHALLRVQPEALSIAAKALDSFLNNQSLVLLFTYRGKQLLFVGDAQAGNWEHWLYDTDSPDKAPGAIAKEGAQILSTIDFYKVGHHGSTNATPIAAVKALREDIVAMCSTQEDVYGSPGKGTEVPRTPLLEAIAEHRTLVRSDALEVEVDGKKIPRGKGAPELGQPSAGRLVENDYSIDYFL